MNEFLHAIKIYRSPDDAEMTLADQFRVIADRISEDKPEAAATPPSQYKAHVSGLMQAWRRGEISFPRAYTEMHEQAARADLPRMSEKHGLKILATDMVRDGWGDGLRVLSVVARDAKGRLRDIVWSDANGGSWFEKSATSGGSFLLEVPDARPGFH